MELLNKQNLNSKTEPNYYQKIKSSMILPPATVQKRLRPQHLHDGESVCLYLRHTTFICLPSLLVCLFFFFVTKHL